MHTQLVKWCAILHADKWCSEHEKEIFWHNALRAFCLDLNCRGESIHHRKRALQLSLSLEEAVTLQVHGHQITTIHGALRATWMKIWSTWAQDHEPLWRGRGELGQTIGWHACFHRRTCLFAGLFHDHHDLFLHFICIEASSWRMLCGSTGNKHPLQINVHSKESWIFCLVT